MTKQVSHPGARAIPRAAPTPEERLDQLNRIIRSRAMQDSEHLITLLQYLACQSCDHPNTQVTQHTIAQKVFRRDGDFDARTDSIVRVQTKNLRTKLQIYYETVGKGDDVLVEIPKGQYRVTFSYREPEDETDLGLAATVDSDAALPTSAVQPTKRPTDYSGPALAAGILVLCAIIVLLVIQLTNLQKELQESSPRPVRDVATEYAAVWSPFMASDTSTVIVLSNPPVYRFLNNADLPSVSNDSVELPAEQEQKLKRALGDTILRRQDHPPRLVLSTSSYTGVGEAIGLYVITDLFRSAGKGLTLRQSRMVHADDIKNHNVILLGSVWVNDWAERLPVKEDFVIGVNASIENHNPQSGERSEYRPAYDEKTGKVLEDYALITVKPGITESQTIMTLAGLLSEGTQAAAEFVTKTESLRELDQLLRQLGADNVPPRYYQVLLRVGVVDGIPTRTSLLTIHPLQVTRE